MLHGGPAHLIISLDKKKNENARSPWLLKNVHPLRQGQKFVLMNDDGKITTHK